MVHVFVNGRPAVAGGTLTAERAGRVLRKNREPVPGSGGSGPSIGPHPHGVR
jgi:hypothetical protein